MYRITSRKAGLSVMEVCVNNKNYVVEFAEGVAIVHEKVLADHLKQRGFLVELTNERGEIL